MQGNDGTAAGRKGLDESDYANLLMLEEMDSLLEELDDMGISQDFQPEQLSDDLAELARALNVHSVDDLTARIAALHAALDRQESDQC
jgi:uncharacterized small protein (DUF1192 family)